VTDPPDSLIRLPDDLTVLPDDQFHGLFDIEPEFLGRIGRELVFIQDIDGFRGVDQDVDRQIAPDEFPAAEPVLRASATCVSRLFSCSTLLFSRAFPINMPYNGALLLKRRQVFLCKSSYG